MPRPFFVYLLELGNGALYAGVARDVAKRVATHRAGRGSRLARSFGVRRLRYVERHANLSSALRRERVLKRLPREKRKRLIQAASPSARRLLRTLLRPSARTIVGRPRT